MSAKNFVSYGDAETLFTGVGNKVKAKANQTQLATVEASTTASKAYSSGEYLVLGGVLYKVTANIAQGGTIVTEGAGKNVDLATVGGELNAINSNILSKCTVAIYNMAGGQTVNILHEDMIVITSDRGGLYSDGIANRGLNDLVASTQITVTHVDAEHVTVANNSQYGTSIMVIGRGTITITPVE